MFVDGTPYVKAEPLEALGGPAPSSKVFKKKKLKLKFYP
jgi:hypothetical protein